MSVFTAVEAVMVAIGKAETEIVAGRAKREAQDKQLADDIAKAEKDRPPDPQQPPS